MVLNSIAKGSIHLKQLIQSSKMTSMCGNSFLSDFCCLQFFMRSFIIWTPARTSSNACVSSLNPCLVRNSIKSRIVSSNLRVGLIMQISWASTRSKILNRSSVNSFLICVLLPPRDDPNDICPNGNLYRDSFLFGSRLSLSCFIFLYLSYFFFSSFRYSSLSYFDTFNNSIFQI